MKELVNKLANLQAELKTEKRYVDGDEVIITLREAVADAKGKLEMAEKALADDLAYYAPTHDKIVAAIDDVKDQIIDEWDGEKKTIQFDVGTLKFRTTPSLDIVDGTLVLTGLLDHTSVKDVVNNYITGFNKTSVKKYMGVLDLPMGAAEINSKTTVKLAEKSG